MTATQNHARAGLVEQHEAAAAFAAFTESGRGHRFRTPILALEGSLAVGGVVGTVQLMAGVGAPDLGVLVPLGLATWRLPALWLFLTVVVPSTWAAWLAWRRTRAHPRWCCWVLATLAIELVVQIPFLGWSVLQAIFGAVAVGLAVLALQARRREWDGSPTTSGVRRGVVMKALVVFESMWGNTEKVAHAVAAGLAESMEVTTVDVSRAPTEAGAEFGLIVAGGPTHAFSMSRTRTRADAYNRAEHPTATPPSACVTGWTGCRRNLMLRRWPPSTPG